MRIVLVICHRCHLQAKIEVLDEEDIRRNPTRPRSPVRCQRCWNVDVEVRR